MKPRKCSVCREPFEPRTTTQKACSWQCAVEFTAKKKATLQAWAYWWKGYAYAQLGSMYYAGLIQDKSATINNKFVDRNAIIAESDKQLKLAQTTLSSISNQGEYGAMIAQLIPSQNQVALGQAPTSAQWIKSINTSCRFNQFYG